MIKENDIKKIYNCSKNIRKKILTMAFEAGSSSAHIGGALSIADILSTLFFNTMTVVDNEPQNDLRDRFILSKGHACLAYYASLSEVGHLSDEQLKTFEKNDTELPGHPVMNKKFGIFHVYYQTRMARIKLTVFFVGQIGIWTSVQKRRKTRK